MIELDGRTGEGGGQLIRVAIALAALTTQPVRITNVRGNRPSRGGGSFAALPDPASKTITLSTFPPGF